MDNFQKNILNFFNQFKIQPQIFNFNQIKKQRVSSLVIFGMGGSGFLGKLIQNLQPELNLNCFIYAINTNEISNKLVQMPNTLFLGISFSGNTKETLFVLQKLIKFKKIHQTVLITTGGKMLKIANQFQIPLVLLPSLSLTPREATGLMYSGVSQVLKTVFKVKLPKISSINTKQILKESYNIAQQINGNIIIYTKQQLQHLGLLWKNNFNETSKNLAFYNTYPEVNHNEIEGFNKISGIFTIILLDINSTQFGKKIQFLTKLLKNKKIKVINVKLKGKNDWQKTWFGILLSLGTSYYLALKNKFNPQETKIVEKIKNL